MAGDTKKTSQLGVTTTLANTDRVVVLTNPASSAQTQTITVNNFINSMRYASNTGAGIVKVGRDLSVNATGFLNLQIVEDLLVPGNIDIANDIFIGDGMGPSIFGNTSLFIYTTFEEAGNENFGGSISYPNTYQMYTGFYSNTNDDSQVYIELNNDDSQASINILNQTNNYSWTFGITTDVYNPAASITSDQPMIIRSDSFVTSVYNESVNGFAELLWHNPNSQSANTPSDSDFFVQGDGAWLYNTKYNSSNNFVIYGWHWDMDGVFNIPSNGDIKRDGVSVLSVASMLSPNIAYTGVFNGYPATIPVTKGQGIFFTGNNYTLETTNKYWMSQEFDTSNYDLSGTETIDFNNIGGIGDYFSLGGKGEILLTSVDLHDVTVISNNFYIRDLPVLETFSANSLAYVGGSFQIDTMDNANTQFNFPNLKTINGSFYYTYNNTLENTPQFPALETTNNIYIYYNGAAQNTMTFDSMSYINYASIYQNNGMLAGPEFPALTSFDYFDMNNNDYMIDPPTFPVVETITNSFYFYNHDVVTSAPAFPSLVTSSYIQISGNALMVDGFDFSSLVTVNNSMNFDNNVSVTESPTFPLLQTINGTFTMDNNPLVTSGLSFPSLKTFYGNFSVNGCGFDETTINNLLVTLAGLDGTNGTTSYDNRSVYVNGGTNAIPTGAGLTAITTLEGRGCVVYYNTP